MWPFRRRSKAGRHELGAAVTAIPSLRPPSYEPPEANPVISPEPSAAEGPRIELGFRDGSTAALAPGSEQARALTEIASVLTQRD
jgi:hypothetical protein